MVGLVLGVALPWVRSVVVEVKLPVALKETVRLVVPPARAAADGSVAVKSLALELSALSAEMLLPPVGEVILRSAHKRDELNPINPKTGPRRSAVVFLIA